jgi:hypothetical protein
MLSDTISRPSLPNYQSGQAHAAESAAHHASTRLRQLASRIDPWLALGVVALGGWASWAASHWLLDSWQLQ